MSEHQAGTEGDTPVRPVLTDRQGHPITDDGRIRAVGRRGPAMLDDHYFIEKISSFTRERIPERVIHARGFLCHGTFTATGRWGEEPIGRYTRACVFADDGKRTPVAVRFSTMTGASGSSESARDPRGFAVKFYTEDGNWDLVGSSLPVAFIRDPLRFPDLVHALKPDPVSGRASASRAFDFLSGTPESMQMVVDLFSPRGIPADFRHMQGFGVNTYTWINPTGEVKLVKYHLQPTCGVASLTGAAAAAIQAGELGHASRDLYEAIERGDHPEWILRVQLMDDDEHPELDFDPLDPTKVWPENLFPARTVGSLRLDRNVSDTFTENEQAAFGAGVVIDGMALSDDRMLVGRAFAYGDAQRYRLGSNYLNLPVNSPQASAVRTHMEAGAMATAIDPGGVDPHVNYEPATRGGLRESAPRGYDDEAQTRVVSGRRTRASLPRTNDYAQAGQRYRLMERWERDDLVTNLVTALCSATPEVQQRMVWHLLMCEDELGSRVATGLGVALEDIRQLPPLPGQTLTAADSARLSRLGRNGPRKVTGLRMTHCVPDSEGALH
jgi:catalase